MTTTQEETFQKWPDVASGCWVGLLGHDIANLQWLLYVFALLPIGIYGEIRLGKTDKTQFCPLGAEVLVA